LHGWLLLCSGHPASLAGRLLTPRTAPEHTAVRGGPCCPIGWSTGGAPEHARAAAQPTPRRQERSGTVLGRRVSVGCRASGLLGAGLLGAGLLGGRLLGRRLLGGGLRGGRLLGRRLLGGGLLRRRLLLGGALGP